MSTSMAYLRISIGLFYLIWGIILTCHVVNYSFGDKKHIHQLLSIFVKNVKKWETHNNTAVLGTGGGGMFMLFCIAYPFIRHKIKNRKWTFDIFMFINCAWLVTFIILIILSQLAKQ